MPEPLLTVVRGEPSAEEIAALVAVLAAAARRTGPGSGPGARRRPGLWSSKAALARTPPGHGPGAWRASARPV